jgi:hypothetical protein
MQCYFINFIPRLESGNTPIFVFARKSEIHDMKV